MALAVRNLEQLISSSTHTDLYHLPSTLQRGIRSILQRMSQMSTAVENTARQAPGQEQPGAAGKVRPTKRVPVSTLLNSLLQSKPRSEGDHKSAETSEAQEVATVGRDSQEGGREQSAYTSVPTTVMSPPRVFYPPPPGYVPPVIDWSKRYYPPRPPVFSLPTESMEPSTPNTSGGRGRCVETRGWF